MRGCLLSAQLYEDEPGCWVGRVELWREPGLSRAVIAFAVRVSQWPNSLYMDPNFPASDFLPLGELEVCSSFLSRGVSAGGWYIPTILVRKIASSSSRCVAVRLTVLCPQPRSLLRRVDLLGKPDRSFNFRPPGFLAQDRFSFARPLNRSVRFGEEERGCRRNGRPRKGDSAGYKALTTGGKPVELGTSHSRRRATI